MPTKVLKNLESEHLNKYVDMSIRKAPAERVKETLCLKPLARCHVSNKHLFLKKTVKVRVIYTAKGEYLIDESFYFEPKRYTWFLLGGDKNLY